MSLATYDPNIRFAKHTVEINLQMWDYRLTVETTLGGNCRGMTILEHALANYGDELFDAHGENPTLILKRPAEDGDGEDTLECSPDEDDIEGWLEKLCVGLRIIKHEKEPSPVSAPQPKEK